jgi:hypothetical protein
LPDDLAIYRLKAAGETVSDLPGLNAADEDDPQA